jgi:hypothetical protein
MAREWIVCRGAGGGLVNLLGLVGVVRPLGLAGQGPVKFHGGERDCDQKLMTEV